MGSREREAAIRERDEALFRLMVESVEDYAIFMLDANGRIATWNKGAERIKGYRDTEILGQPYATFFTPEDVQSGKPQTLKPLAEQKALVFVNEVPETLPSLLADDQRIRQVLVNLVGNAIKFTPEGGRIRLRARMTPEGLTCEIEDNGIGIAPEDLDKLFKAFTQVDMSSTRHANGTGLGLSISKSILEAHGGKIGARSAGLGHGSTFWFTLPPPLVESPAPAQGARRGPDRPGSRLR